MHYVSMYTKAEFTWSTYGRLESYGRLIRKIWQKMKKNTSWKFMDVSGPGEFGLSCIGGVIGEKPTGKG